MLEKPHKFFERYPDINLTKLDSYLHGVYEQMRESGWFGDPNLPDPQGMTIDVTGQYNLFRHRNEEIQKLRQAIKDMLIEASEYYGYNFDEENYVITAWFNLWRNLYTENIEDKAWHFHDQVGAPHFHGYYCVNAEPSITYYNINNQIIENNNKNNRAILSETNHAHAAGDWRIPVDRITIAYDIMPKKHVGNEDIRKFIHI